MQEIQVPSLGQEESLEKGKATHSSILAWEIPWTEEPGGLQSLGSQRVEHDRAWRTHTRTHTHTKETKMTDLKSTETQKSHNGPCAVMQGQGLSGAQPAALSPVPTAARGMEKHCTSPAASGLKAGRKITP